MLLIVHFKRDASFFYVRTTCTFLITLVTLSWLHNYLNRALLAPKVYLDTLQVLGLPSSTYAILHAIWSPSLPLFVCNTQCKCIGDLTPYLPLGAYVLNGRHLSH